MKTIIQKIATRWMRIYIVVVFMLLAAGCSSMNQEDVYKTINVKPGTKLYTAYNIHQRGNVCQSANYQWPPFLPVGTEVKAWVIVPKRAWIQDVKTGQKITIEYSSKYNGDFSAFLKNLLTDKDFKEQTKGLSKETIDKILCGVPEIGMTKAEVIMTCGYPPKHRTLSTDCRSWVYWESKFNTFTVIFDRNGKIIKIRGLYPAKAKE